MNHSEIYRAAFAGIIETYQELKHTPHGLEPMVDVMNPDPAAPQRNKSSFSPTVSDFVCDVENSVNRALTPAEIAYFNYWYKSLRANAEQSPEAEVDKTVREALGERFIKVGIYPISDYLNASSR